MPVTIDKADVIAKMPCAKAVVAMQHMMRGFGHFPAIQTQTVSEMDDFQNF
jgi:hypothetical protein